MSKSNKEPKTKEVEQLKLFTGNGVALSNSGGGTTGSGVLAELLSRLDIQRTLTTGIMENIADYVSLAKSFQEVKRNGGTGGTDGMTLEMYEGKLLNHLKELQTELLSGTYLPKAVKGVIIPKATGGTRQLGIPTIGDRVVQQSIQRCLQPVYDPYFSESSYGFRPGRSAQAAVEQASRHVQSGKVWVVEIDLANFFDEIHHERLLSRLRKAISDKRLLRLIHLYLRTGLLQGGMTTQRLSGTPQGGPLSPLLSNIVLDELDKELEKRGLSFVRYADDCNIYVRSRRSAERVLASVGKYIEEKLKLKVNWEKSGVRECNHVKFLGHTIEQTGKIRISDASIEHFKIKIREITKRNLGKRFGQIIESVNKVTQGWGVYYRKSNTWLGKLKYLDGWLRKRLRCYALKQHQRRYATYVYLRQLGIGKSMAWNAVMYRQWWAMANYRPVAKAMGIRWFIEQGLRSLQVIQSG